MFIKFLIVLPMAIVVQGPRILPLSEVVQLVEIKWPNDYPDLASSYTLAEIPDTSYKIDVLVVKEPYVNTNKPRPKIALIGTVRGVEPTHTMLLNYVHEKLWALSQSGRDQDLNEYHVLFVMDPQGFDEAVQDKCFVVVDYDHYTRFPNLDLLNATRGRLLYNRSPVVQAMINWILDQKFTLIMTFLTGDLKVSLQ